MDIQTLNFSYLKETHRDDLITEGLIASDNINLLPFPIYPSRINSSAFCICRTGYGILEINLVRYQIVPNNVVILLPDHIIQVIEVSTDFSASFFAFSSEYADEIQLSTRTDISLYFHVKECPVSLFDENEVEIIKEYYDLFKKKGKIEEQMNKRMIIQCLFLTMLYEFSGIYQKRLPKNAKKKSRKEELFENFVKLVFQHFRQQRNLIFYANKLCLTPKYLSSLCQSVSGKTGAEWIEEVVILEAKALLKTPGTSVQMVSDALDFPNQSFFGKYFKRLTGMTPSEYKALLWLYI